MNYWCVVPAAGSGRRVGSDIPKQYLTLLNATVMQHTLDRLCGLTELAQIVVAVSADDRRAETLDYRHPEKLRFVTGGAERADSVLAGLKALAGQAADSDWVLVHDVARPCVRLADIRRLMQVASGHAVGGILAHAVRDTMKRADAGQNIAATVPREALWHALTPQMFRYGQLRDALKQGLAAGAAITDEASALERLGLRPALVEGARDNLKITYPEDLTLAGLYLAAQATEDN